MKILIDVAKNSQKLADKVERKSYKYVLLH